MGAQWKQAGREANAQKKGQMVVKLVREIMVAAKLGGPDPDLNPRLFAAVEKARRTSMATTASVSREQVSSEPLAISIHLAFPLISHRLRNKTKGTAMGHGSLGIDEGFACPGHGALDASMVRLIFLF